MIAEDKDVVSLAWQEVGELCAGKPWRMSIPVRETDSDRVIANALTTVTERCNGLLSRVAELTEALREVLSDTYGMPEGRVEKLRELLEERPCFHGDDALGAAEEVTR